jgi:hypothetical protein
VPFEQGRVIVDLTEEHPRVACTFENTEVRTPPSPQPTPTPTPTPTPVPPAPLPPPLPPAPAPAPPRADLVVTKRALASSVRSGSIVAFEVTVSNRGEGAAENAAMAEKPRHGGQIIGARPSQGSCAQHGELLVCRLGTLEPGASATIRVRVRATAEPALDNLAVAGSSVLDATLRNNADEARVRILFSRAQPRARCASRC